MEFMSRAAECRIVAASSGHILAIVPEDVAGGKTIVHLESLGAVSNTFEITIGERLTGEMHIVANPAIDPTDDALDFDAFGRPRPSSAGHPVSART